MAADSNSTFKSKGYGIFKIHPIDPLAMNLGGAGLAKEGSKEGSFCFSSSHTAFSR